MSALMDHFQDTLKDVYYAEKQIYKALPKMIKAASNDDLRAGFESHRDETAGQIERLEKVFALLDMKPRGKPCPAIDGILEEGEELIGEHDKGAGLDAALAAAAQAVEHYEIARYGTLCSWAETLGLRDAKKLLGKNLDEEETCDKTLSELAESALNASAANGADEGEEEDVPSEGKSQLSKSMAKRPRAKQPAKARR
jgi:ferritin-like metal-binding protein YciE